MIFIIILYTQAQKTSYLLLGAIIKLFIFILLALNSIWYKYVIWFFCYLNLFFNKNGIELKQLLSYKK